MCVGVYVCVDVDVDVYQRYSSGCFEFGGFRPYPVPIIKPPPDIPRCTPPGIEGGPRQHVARVGRRHPPATSR